MTKLICTFNGECYLHPVKGERGVFECSKCRKRFVKNKKEKESDPDYVEKTN